MSSLIRKFRPEPESFLLGNPFYTSFTHDAVEVSGGAQRLRRRLLGSGFLSEPTLQFCMSSIILKCPLNSQMSPLIENQIRPEKSNVSMLISTPFFIGRKKLS